MGMMKQLDQNLTKNKIKSDLAFNEYRIRLTKSNIEKYERLLDNDDIKNFSVNKSQLDKHKERLENLIKERKFIRLGQ